MFKSHGILQYDPKADASKYSAWWCKLDVHPSIVRYYQAWIEKTHGYTVNTPIWKAHITVIRGETPAKPWFWKKYQGEKVEFEYSPDLKSSPLYFWLTAYSPRLEEIRTELGMKPQPRVPFHITIGNVKNKVAERKEIKVPFRVFPWERPEIVDTLWRK